MVFVGTFTEKDIASGKDKIEIQRKMKETGLMYTQTKLAKKGGKIIGLKIWVCSSEEFTV